MSALCFTISQGVGVRERHEPGQVPTVSKALSIREFVTLVCLHLRMLEVFHKSMFLERRLPWDLECDPGHILNLGSAPYELCDLEQILRSSCCIMYTRWPAAASTQRRRFMTNKDNRPGSSGWVSLQEQWGKERARKRCLWCSRDTQRGGG